MKQLALAAAAALALALPAAPDSGLAGQRFVNAGAGHALRIPPGWQAYEVEGTTVVSSRRLARPGASPGTVRLRQGDVYVRIDETASQVYVGDERERPDRFTKLPSARGYDCGFGEGHALLFRERTRHFHVFVRLGPRTSPRDALAVVNSLRLTK